jgi:hypothetical protein
MLHVFKDCYPVKRMSMCEIVEAKPGSRLQNPLLLQVHRNVVLPELWSSVRTTKATPTFDKQRTRILRQDPE